MAQVQTVALIDDLDGTTAEQTVTFSVDGQPYEIDLSRQNIQRLHNVLAPFIANARRAREAPSTRRRTRRPGTTAPTPPAVTSTPPAEVTTSEGNGTTPAPRPVPAALFSNPHDSVPSRTAIPPKPHTAGLFSATTG